MFIEINPAHNREGQTIQTPRQSHRPEPMPAGAYLKFRNDWGVREICIGVKEFKCIGESPPQDHPHIYHNQLHIAAAQEQNEAGETLGTPTPGVRHLDENGPGLSYGPVSFVESFRGAGSRPRARNPRTRS
jgi:uncharacterized Zn-finger protein